MTIYGKLGRVLCVATVLVAIPALAHAQEGFSVELRGGPVFPTGEVAEITNTGGTIAGSLAYRFHPGFALRIDGATSFLEEGEIEPGLKGPGINFFHLTGAVAARLLHPYDEDEPFTLSGILGAGISIFEVEAFIARRGPQEGETFTFRDDYFTLTGGLEAGYELGRHIALVLSGRTYVVFTDEEDTALLESLSTEIERFGTAWTFPLTVGVRFST